MARLEQNIITFFWVKKKKEPSTHESLIEVVATSTKPNQTNQKIKKSRKPNLTYVWERTGG